MTSTMPIIWTVSGTPSYLIKLPMLFIGYYTNSPPNSNACLQNLSHMLSLCNRIGTPIKTRKVDGPTTCLVFLGIVLDTITIKAIIFAE